MEKIFLDPETFLCLSIWFIISVFFTVYQCNRIEKELTDYIDEKLSEFTNESNIDLDKLKKALDNEKNKLKR